MGTISVMIIRPLMGAAAPLRRRALQLLLVIGLAALLGLCSEVRSVEAQEQDPGSASHFSVVAVQFEVSEDRYRSIQDFEEALVPLLQRAVEKEGADLVVFPEYINVPALFAPYAQAVREAASLEEALREIVGDRAGPEALPRLIAGQARGYHDRLVAMWRDLAREHDTAIAAGTFFVHSGTAGGGSPDIRNRTIVFGPTGETIYRQDKVFLTPFEADVLRLEAGELRDARLFSLEERELAVTICRDSYFEVWDSHLQGADLWIDLRANGEPYGPGVRKRFLETLPDRVLGSGAQGGVNASLTGRYLDLLWQGPSYAVDRRGDRVVESPTPQGDSLVAFHVRLPGN